MNFEDLVGMTFSKVHGNEDEVYFEMTNGRRFVMNHHQECCESVYLESGFQELLEIVDSGEEILEAYESISDLEEDHCGVEQHTFYHIRTNQHNVCLRWIGSSNGYYSTDVEFKELK